MKSSTLKAMAALLSIALLLALAIFLYPTGDTEKLPANQKAPKPIVSAGELEAVLSGTRASIEKIISGRIVYEKRLSKSPDRYSVMDVMDGESNLKRYEEGPTKQDQEWKTIDSKGEYIFEGNRFYHTVAIESGNPYLYQFYCQEGKKTVIESSRDGVRARIKDGCETGIETSNNPLYLLIRLLPFLSRSDLEISNIERRNDGKVYTIRRSLEHAVYTVDIMSDSGYFLAEYKLVADGTLLEWIRFNKKKWSSNAEIYYPTEIIKDTFAKKFDFRYEYILLDVELNIDVDDEVFQPKFEAGTFIIDRRFWPPRSFIYSFPDYADEYLAELDEEAKMLEEEN